MSTLKVNSIEASSGSEIDINSTLGTVPSIVVSNLNVTGVVTATSFTVSGAIQATGGINLGDGDKANFGDSNDLEIYHDGNNSAINDKGTGDFYIQGSSNIFIRDYDTSENHIQCVKNGAVSLYYDNSKKFETTSIGAKLTGELVVNGPPNPADYSLTDGIFVQPANGLAGLTITSGSATNNAYINFSAGTASNAEQFAFAIGRDGSNGQGMVKINDADVARFGSTGIIMPSGKGIDFSANANASGMTSELLNDYEEGTWTPTITGSLSSGTGTYTAQEGFYTKVGRVVTVYGRVWWTAHTGTGKMRLSSLPFTTPSGAPGNCSGIVGYYENLAYAANTHISLITTAGSDRAEFLNLPIGGGTATATDIDTAALVIFSITYTV